jgi:hypothetical protein
MQALTAGCQVQLRRHIRESPIGGTSSHRAVFRDSLSFSFVLGFGAFALDLVTFEGWAFIFFRPRAALCAATPREGARLRLSLRLSEFTRVTTFIDKI